MTEIRSCQVKWSDAYHKDVTHECYMDAGHSGPCQCKCGQKLTMSSSSQSSTSPPPRLEPYYQAITGVIRMIPDETERYGNPARLIEEFKMELTAKRVKLDMIASKLDSLPWRNMGSDGGQWIFLYDISNGGNQDRLNPALAGLEEILGEIKKAEYGGMRISGWRYSVSKDKFLNRFPAQVLNRKGT